MYLSSPSGIMAISDNESVLIGTFLCHVLQQKDTDFLLLVQSFNIRRKGFVVCLGIFNQTGC